MVTLSNITEELILGELDEYSLYVHYLQFEPVIGCKYRSRLRTLENIDSVPSFGLYRKKYGDKPNEFMWKDQAIPAPNFGDIFDLVLKLYPSLETRFNAQLKIVTDFGLIEGVLDAEKHLQTFIPVEKPTCRIRTKTKPFTSQAITYWNYYGIDVSQLHKYNVHQVKYFFLYEEDIEPRAPQGNMYDYRVFDKHQLYQPVPKKFFMDLIPTCILGFQQFDKNQDDLLVYTKSMKDVMFLDSLGIPTLGSIAENNIPLPEFLDWSKRFKRRIIFQDNDGKTSEHLYTGFESVKIPHEYAAKDPTDFRRKYGHTDTLTFLKTLLSL